MKKSVLLCMLVFGLSLQFVKANGLNVTNVSLQGQNITNQTWQIQYNLTWNTSWRDGINYDAAWVFIKFRIHTGPWQHAIINTSGFNTGTGTASELRVSPDGMGAIVNRSANGLGTYAVTGMQLQWNYGISNVQNTDLPQVRVFAIEMVQIPEGPFGIGDGDGTNESTSALGVADNKYYIVTTELSPPLRADGNFSNGNNILRIDGDGGVDNNGDGVIDNSNYPVGYNAFFMMKYNITQEQYADFLTTLLPTQAAPRYQGMNGTNRYTIASSGGLFFTDRPDRACNYMSWIDGLAYADWSGLRPFTETEYEKACRGPIAPIWRELAWGNSTLSPTFNSTTNSTTAWLYITGSENGTETPSSSSYRTRLYRTENTATATFMIQGGDGGQGPVRVGIFSEPSETNREITGSSYYGVQDLSGNVEEQMINITNPTGRNFTGLHGNGAISSTGEANVSNWPTSTGSGYKPLNSDAWGAGTTVFGLTAAVNAVGVSGRTHIESSRGTSRVLVAGFRCARTQWW